MTKPKMSYFENEDVLHIILAEGAERHSVEIEPNVTAELDADGNLIGLEILKASTFLRDRLMDSVSLKLPPLAKTA